MEKKHVVGLLGCGYWGANYVNTLSELSDVRLKCICDLHDPKASLLRKAETFTNIYQDMLSDPEINSIIIATPTQEHYWGANQALRSGKHVLVEKPMTSNSKQSDALIASAIDNERVLMTGHVFMYHPAVNKLKECIEGGEMGVVKSITARRMSLGPIRYNENVIWDLMPHDISMFLYLNPGNPVSVNATGQAFNGGLEDIATMSMKFDNGAFTSVTASWINPLKTRDLIVVGDKKMAVFDDAAANKLAIYDKSATIPADPTQYAINYREGDVVLPHVSAEAPLKLECRHFFDCIEQGKTPRSDGINGKMVVKILEAAQQSLRERGREVLL